MGINKMRTKILALCISAALSFNTVGLTVNPANAQAGQVNITITNPYKNVDWASFGQYKAAHHTHSTFSDGSNTRRDMLIDKYNKGFDIVAMTDHDTTTGAWYAAPSEDSWNNNWNDIGTATLSMAETWDINNGTYDASNFPGTYTGRRQQNNGMIGMGFSNEISANGGFSPGVYGGHHMNAFFAYVPGNVGSIGRTMAEVIQYVQDAGGITHINHPGRYTGAQNNADLSRDPVNVNRYAQLFMDFPSLVGVEIINKWDGESVNDRILWDNILMQTAPQGRLVWGFSNDDSHSLSGNGHAWNVMLMPTFDEAAVKTSMETGAFYGVSRIDRHHGINHLLGGWTPGAPQQTTTTDTQYTGGVHNNFALGMLDEPAPSITKIVTSGNAISVYGEDFHTVVWIADGAIISTGNTIDLSGLSGYSYVRAELVGYYGVAYTQPFGIEVEESRLVSVSAASSSTNLQNNTTVTITVSGRYDDGSTAILASAPVRLKQNGTQSVKVGDYDVTVVVNGNNKITSITVK